MRFPRLGGYVARLEIPDGSPIEIHKTLGPGHYTLIADPEALIEFLVEVEPVNW